MPPLYLRVFERLIIEANHQDNEIPYKAGKKIIKRGERLTSIRQICQWVGWYERGIFKTPNPKTVKAILDWLQQNGMIEIYGDEGNRKETHYRIVNYDIYQSDNDVKVTEKKQSGNSKETEKKQSMDTNKNDKECTKNEKNEKNDKEDILSATEVTDTPSQIPPYQEILESYNTLCPSLPKVKQMTDKRRKHIKAAWVKFKGDIDKFVTVFKKAEASDFLSGRNGKWTGCNFDWLITYNNMVKVLEDTYINKTTGIHNKDEPQKRIPRAFASLMELSQKGGIGKNDPG